MLPDGRYELHGIDFSENMIDEAKKSCKTPATFTVADAEKLPLMMPHLTLLYAMLPFITILIQTQCLVKCIVF